MPGKQKRDGTKPLTRLQSKIAGNVLKPHFDPSLGERQWDDSAKAQLVQAVKEAFAAGGHDAEYTTRKLEDWVSNGIYRWRKAGQKPLPARGGAAPPPAASAAVAAQPRKRDRVLSSITMKPQEKMVRAADPSGKWSVAAPCARPPRSGGLTSSVRCADLLPGWPSAGHDPDVSVPPPEPGAPPPEAMIRRRAKSERSMRIQAEDDLRAEAV